MSILRVVEPSVNQCNDIACLGIISGNILSSC